MNELALYILDLAQNSVAAGARTIRVYVLIDPEADQIRVRIEDDGCGMDEALLKRVTSPFATTRKTRKVGMGIPMAKQLCEMCEGAFDIQSRLGAGTALALTYKRSHVDAPPMGDLAGSMMSLINGAPEGVDIYFEYARAGDVFAFDTREVREALGGVELHTPDVLLWIRDYLSEGMQAVDR